MKKQRIINDVKRNRMMSPQSVWQMETSADNGHKQWGHSQRKSELRVRGVAKICLNLK